MELRLTLKGPERLLAGRTGASLREGALTIGRSPEAGWPIADPERIISKIHCRIEKDFDSFQLTDLSTNGVKVNETPVGYGLACRIEHGDVVKLGDAVVTVEILAAQARPEEPVLPIVELPVQSMEADGPFGAPGAESPAPQSVTAVQRPVESPATGMVLDDWWEPAAAQATQAPTIPVDISAPPPAAAIADVHTGEDSVWSKDTGVASLQRMAAGLDVGTFAQAVEEAVAVLSVGERNRFRERLSEIIRNAPGR